MCLISNVNGINLSIYLVSLLWLVFDCSLALNAYQSLVICNDCEFFSLKITFEKFDGPNKWLIVLIHSPIISFLVNLGILKRMLMLPSLRLCSALS